MKNVRLYLIRHGITAGNLQRRYIGGQTDEPLCEEGKAQLVKLYDSFEYPNVGAVLSSPMKRCIQTADILYPSHTNKIIIDQLRECNFGEFENKGIDQLKDNNNFKRWLSPAKHYTPEGGESAPAFHARCADTFLKLMEYLIKSGITEAACITHGGVIMSMLSQCALPRKLPEQWMADSGCGYVVQCSAAMLMRDKLGEVTDIVPFGYLKEK